MSYAQLERDARTAARRLAALGVGAGDRVATMLPAGLELARLLHAVPKIGAVLVPLNPGLTAPERRALMGDAAARLVVAEPLQGDEAEVELRAEVNPGEPWTVIFSSGTTGRPKPIVLSHGNHAASAIASAWNLGVAPDDAWLCVLPTFHVGGLAVLIRAAVYGTAAILHERFQADRAAAALSGGQATMVSLVPTMLRRLAGEGLDSAPRLRAMLLGGAAAPRELVDWALSRRFPVALTYGMTETASQIAAAAHAGEGARPLPGVEVRISASSDPASGATPGREGEILVRGPMVARGSLGADGWLHTGDRGRLDDRGLLHVEGRIDDLIVTGGENVAPAEVEDALLAHPGVVEAAVTGEPDPDWGQAVVAYVVTSRPVATADLRQHCRARLPGFKVPKEVRFVTALPRNRTGKVDLGTLRSGGSPLAGNRIESGR